MKKLLLLSLSLVSINAVAMDTNIMTSIAGAHGKVGHMVESYSQHGFYIYNDSSQIKVYTWFIKQCEIHNGIPNVCPGYVNQWDRLTLQPGQIFEFHKNLDMHMQCGAHAGTVGVYALSHLTSSTGESWDMPVTNEVVCDY